MAYASFGCRARYASEGSKQAQCEHAPRAFPALFTRPNEGMNKGGREGSRAKPQRAKLQKASPNNINSKGIKVFRTTICSPLPPSAL